MVVPFYLENLPLAAYVEGPRHVDVFDYGRCQLVAVSVHVPSVCLSVPSIDSSSGVQLFCCSSGAGDRYRSIAPGAAYRSILAAHARSGQRRAVVRGTRVDTDLSRWQSVGGHVYGGRHDHH